ncbi:alpha/beta fold hydrolase [Phenylobacterium sp.]|jgi:pimeloyl-ACP methyl ester carboxylesterase|uniref:alpha/beta fold hydrolase n=1 Tax=Phenylobacterium sp. TaxID=1871053 RepID=UPI002E30DABF|nr:alpha/beta fold hydrolase [Phenylobacterium sp.]HEX2559655.1 alpha/beta fold hydrolase [Phenylobacterium sp.]
MHIKTFAAAAVAALGLASAAHAGAGTITIDGGAKMIYHRNVAASSVDASKTVGVITIHGTNRNADDYYDYTVRAASDAGELGSTLIWVPEFEASSASGYAEWSSSGWKYGENDDTSFAVSSFTAVDTLIRKMADKTKFPNLTKVVVIGHSAGGQFVQRYAAASTAFNTSGVDVVYIAANAGSYAYLTSHRWNGSAFTSTSHPTCTAFNTYRYGLTGLPPYLSAVGASTIVSQAPSRPVHLLNGTLDTGVDSDLDTGCEANLQGSQRLERGRRYKSYMDAIFPGHSWTQTDVSGVGHDGEDMIRSAAARALIW